MFHAIIYRLHNSAATIVVRSAVYLLVYIEYGTCGRHYVLVLMDRNQRYSGSTIVVPQTILQCSFEDTRDNI